MGITNLVVGGPVSFSVGGTDVGHTKGGAKLRCQKTYHNYVTDQTFGRVKKTLTDIIYTLSTAFAEVQLPQLRMAWGIGSAALVSSTLSLTEVEDGTKAIVMVAPGPQGGTDTYTFPNGYAMEAQSELAYVRGQEVVVPAEFDILSDGAATESWGNVVSTKG